MRPAAWLRGFARWPLLWQFACLMAACLSVGIAAMAVAGQLAARAQALERARALALVAEAVGAWSSGYRGVWVLSDPTDPGVSAGDSLDHRQARAPGESGADAATGSVDIARTAGTFHRKVPSAVQRELFDRLGRLSAGERVRVTHEPALDPRNAPGRFERSAIAALRPAGAGRDEYAESGDGQLLYARRLTLQADCLRCHAGSAEAPAAMRAKFGATPAWGGLRAGDFGGVVSVAVPLAAAGGGALGGAGLFGVLWLAAWAAALAVLFGWLKRHVVASTRAMEAYAQCLLGAKGDALRASRVVVDGDEMTSRNELHRLSMSLKALHRALRSAYAQPP